MENSFIGKNATADPSTSSVFIGKNATADPRGTFLPGAICDCGCQGSFDDCLKGSYKHLTEEVRKELVKNRMFCVFPALTEKVLENSYNRLFEVEDGGP